MVVQYTTPRGKNAHAKEWDSTTRFNHANLPKSPGLNNACKTQSCPRPHGPDIREVLWKCLSKKEFQVPGRSTDWPKHIQQGKSDQHCEAKEGYPWGTPPLEHPCRTYPAVDTAGSFVAMRHLTPRWRRQRRVRASANNGHGCPVCFCCMQIWWQWLYLDFCSPQHTSPLPIHHGLLQSCKFVAPAAPSSPKRGGSRAEPIPRNKLRGSADQPTEFLWCFQETGMPHGASEESTLAPSRTWNISTVAKAKTEARSRPAPILQPQPHVDWNVQVYMWYMCLGFRVSGL